MVVQGDSPVRCQHDDHFFSNWLCPEASLGKVVEATLHIFTTCIPLIFEYCVEYVDSLVERFNFLTQEVPPESSSVPQSPPRLPPSAVQRFLLSRLEALKEESPVSSPQGAQSESPLPSISRRLSFESERGPPVPEEPPQLAAPIIDDGASSLSEVAFDWLVDFLDRLLEDRGASDEEALYLQGFATVRNCRPIIEEALTRDQIPFERPELILFLRANLTRAVQVVLERRATRTFEDDLAVTAIECTARLYESLPVFDWSTIGLGVDETYHQFLSFSKVPPSPGSGSDSDDDRLIQIKAIPEPIGQAYSLYLGMCRRLPVLLSPKVNLPHPLEQGEVLRGLYRLMEATYTIGMFTLSDIEDYSDETGPDDYIKLLTNSNLYCSRTLLFLGKAYHLVRMKSYYSLEQRKMVMPDLPPSSWSQTFYEQPDAHGAFQAKMRVLYNQFCSNLFNFLGEENWDRLFLEHHEYASWYVPDASAQEYQHPSVMD